MNRLHLVVLTLAFTTGNALAAPPAATMPTWEQLTPAQRDLVIAPIRDRWNSSPEARARLYAHAQRWQQLTPEQRAKVRHGLGKWEHMDPQQRQTMRSLFHAMREMTPEQRKDLRQRWRTMTPEQRKSWVDAHQPPAD